MTEPEYGWKTFRIYAKLIKLRKQINKKFPHAVYYKLMCNRLYDSSSNESLLNELAEI